MSSKYLKQSATRTVPQSEPLRSDQIKSEGGGYVWQIDDWTRMRRFLILGSEGGSHYTKEQDLTKQNIDTLERALRADGKRFVTEVCNVSIKGRAPKQGPTLFALALAASKGDDATRALALGNLGTVCRIPTHLFEFLNYVQLWRGWGPALKRAVANWYLLSDLNTLALHMVKYREREGWKHRDALRLAHPKTEHHDRDMLFRFAVGRAYEAPDRHPTVRGFIELQASKNPNESARLIRQYELPRECVRPEHLKDKEVWKALIDVGMPVTAMVRNLGNMSKCGLLETGSQWTKDVTTKLGDAKAIRKSRLHPMTLLIALKTYAQGHGNRGSGTWTPVPRIIDALDAAFYLAFPNVVPTGKRLLYAIDVSNSMTHEAVADSGMCPREAAAALALVALNTEPDAEVIGYSADVYPLGLSKRQRLDDAVNTIARNEHALDTNCALPALWSITNERNFDGIVQITDNQSWSGDVHVSEALSMYRKLHSPKCRQAIIAMVANDITINDPTDPGSADFVGFDTATPEMISAFLREEI